MDVLRTGLLFPADGSGPRSVHRYGLSFLKEVFRAEGVTGVIKGRDRGDWNVWIDAFSGGMRVKNVKNPYFPRYFGDICLIITVQAGDCKADDFKITIPPLSVGSIAEFACMLSDDDHVNNSEGGKRVLARIFKKESPGMAKRRQSQWEVEDLRNKVK